MTQDMKLRLADFNVEQARPKVKGQREPARAQAIIDKSLVEIHSSFIISA